MQPVAVEQRADAVERLAVGGFEEAAQARVVRRVDEQGNVAQRDDVGLVGEAAFGEHGARDDAVPVVVVVHRRQVVAKDEHQRIGVGGQVLSQVVGELRHGDFQAGFVFLFVVERAVGVHGGEKLEIGLRKVGLPQHEIKQQHVLRVVAETGFGHGGVVGHVFNAVEAVEAQFVGDDVALPEQTIKIVRVDGVIAPGAQGGNHGVGARREAFAVGLIEDGRHRRDGGVFNTVGVREVVHRQTGEQFKRGIDRAAAIHRRGAAKRAKAQLQQVGEIRAEMLPLVPARFAQHDEHVARRVFARLGGGSVDERGVLLAFFLVGRGQRGQVAGLRDVERQTDEAEGVGNVAVLGLQTFSVQHLADRLGQRRADGVQMRLQGGQGEQHRAQHAERKARQTEAVRADAAGKIEQQRYGEQNEHVPEGEVVADDGEVFYREEIVVLQRHRGEHEFEMVGDAEDEV